jgi:hypothetical protein
MRRELDKETYKHREAVIVEQHRGVYPLYAAFYVHSIIYAAERAETAFQRFDAAVGEQRLPAFIVATCRRR